MRKCTTSDEGGGVESFTHWGGGGVTHQSRKGYRSWPVCVGSERPEGVHNLQGEGGGGGQLLRQPLHKGLVTYYRTFAPPLSL